MDKSTLQMELAISREIHQSLIDMNMAQYTVVVDCCDITETTTVDVYTHENGKKMFVKSISIDGHYLSVVDKVLEFIELREERKNNE